MLIVKQFPVHKCGHERSPIGASECLHSLVKKNSSDHYFLATQDADLTERARRLAHVPLVYIKMNTIVMEKPQDLALDMAEQTQEAALTIDDHQLQTLKSLKRRVLGEDAEEEEADKKKKKRKGPKGPNPLSCKKKGAASKAAHPSSSSSSSSSSSAAAGASNSKESRKKRKRANRIPNHIKRMFNKIESELTAKE